MSKLADKLQSVSKGGAQPIGFRPGGIPSKGQSMLLIAALSPGEVEMVTQAMGMAVDAILTYDEGDIIEKLARTAGDIPWGILSNEVSLERVEKLVELGCDFLVFEAEKAPAAVLQEKKMGKILVVEYSLPDSLLAIIGRLSVDAVLLSEESKSPLTVRHMMDCRRIAIMTGKPSLAIVPAAIDDAELGNLWDAGIDGAIVRLQKEKAEEQISKLRRAIKTLPPVNKRGQHEAKIILPQPDVAPTFTEQEEE